MSVYNHTNYLALEYLQAWRLFSPLLIVSSWPSSCRGLISHRCTLLLSRLRRGSVEQKQCTLSEQGGSTRLCSFLTSLGIYTTAPRAILAVSRYIIIPCCLLRLCHQTSPPLLTAPWALGQSGTSQCGPASTAAGGTGWTWAEVASQLQGHIYLLQHHCRLQLLRHGLRLPRLRPLLQHPRLLQEGHQPGQEEGQGGGLRQGGGTASRRWVKWRDNTDSDSSRCSQPVSWGRLWQSWQGLWICSWIWSLCQQVSALDPLLIKYLVYQYLEILILIHIGHRILIKLFLVFSQQI